MDLKSKHAELEALSLQHFRNARELRSAGRTEEAEEEDGLSHKYSLQAEDVLRQLRRQNESVGRAYFLSGLLVVPITLALVDKPLAGVPYVFAGALIVYGLWRTHRV